MLVRSWNLFHGNAVPPRRGHFLREMIEHITEGEPDVVCLQEVPVWGLRRLEDWSGMQAFGAVARRPLVRSARAGRLLTVHHGLLRSAFTGEAGAILVGHKHAADGERRKVVGERPLQRVAHAVRVDGRIDVVNFHTNADLRELHRAAELAGTAEAVLAGDANVPSAAVAGFSPPLEGSIDQILVRGLRLVRGPERVNRTVRGVLLSDHAPLEAVVE